MKGPKELAEEKERRESLTEEVVKEADKCQGDPD